MKGSEFAATFGKQSFVAWEAAAFDLVQSGENLPFTMVTIPLMHKDGRKATIDVMADYFAVGEPGDSIRLPLLPCTAQKIANLTGMLLPTPRLVYRTWQAATLKLSAITLPQMGETSNKGANFAQYAKHNAAINAQLAALGVAGPKTIFMRGHKKDVVVGNIAKPGKVLIQGWYRPPPSPDVFDDHTAMENPTRQPIQPYSNLHGLHYDYADYSHGIAFYSPLMTVEGVDIETEKVFTDLGLCDFVSHEGPVRFPRYPAPFPAAGPGKAQRVASAEPGIFSYLKANTTSYADLGAEVLIGITKKTG